MWRTEFQPTIRRLEAKLLVAKQQLSNKDTSPTTLKVSLSILTKLVAKLDQLKIDSEAASTRKQKVYEEFEIVSATELLLDAVEVIAELEILINKDDVCQSTPIPQAQNANNRSDFTRLPKLELKKFSGDITTFNEFYETFKIAVDNTQLDPIQKFVYLKTSLINDAEKLIAGLPTTKENYEVAKKLLVEKYGNKQHTIQRLYHTLNAMPKATKQTLRQTYDNQESILRSLEAMNEIVEGGALLSMLSKKYPDEILLQVFEEIKADEMTVASLRTSIKNIVTRREKLTIFSTPAANIGTTSNQEKHFATTEALFTYPKSQGKRSKTCRYCGKAHYSDSCDEYTTIEQRKEKIKGSCFICLLEGHNLKKCRVVKPCVYCKKSKNHHRSLCPQQFGDNKKDNKLNETKGDSTVSCLASTVCLQTSNTLLTASAVVQNGSKKVKIRLIFDNDSARSYITEKLFQQLELQSEYSEALQISTFGKRKSISVNTKVSTLLLQLASGEFCSISANVVPIICEDFNVRYPEAVKKTAREKGLHLASDNDDTNSIDLLVGLDYYFHLVTDQRLEAEGSLLIKSKLGWLVAGNVMAVAGNVAGNSNSKSLPCLLIREHDIATKHDISQLWDLDTIGIKMVKNDTEEEEALTSFYESITYEEGSYSVSWPWKSVPPDLPSNYQLAFGRLKTLYKRLDKPLLEKYDKIIHQQYEAGMVEITEKSSTNVCHYLPHHPVITPDKSTDCRIVYDGSAKSKKTNKSLNDCLYKGKVLLEKTCALLLRFRFHEFGVIADIEKAFLRIGLHTKDRDTTRFLWLKDVNMAPTEENLQIFRFTKIPFGIISCPFLLGATIHHHLVNTNSTFANEILPDFYVDNLITGIATVSDGTKLYTEAKKIFANASMNLRQWKSNSSDLNAFFAANNDELLNENVSVLGINWNTNADIFTIKTCIKKENTTKRGILKVSSAVYDPMGFFSPVLLPAKLLIKKLWHLKMEWDQELNTEDALTWYKIFLELSRINEYKIPRFVGKVVGETSLHVFVDASIEAYGAVAYLRTEGKNSTEIRLLFAKARVAPEKGTLSIPRLELIAAVIGVRIVNFIQTSLSQLITINETFLWSDSRCVLSWINAKKVLPSFVEHRVREIRQYKQIQFCYVPSTSNPADIASRGCTMEELQKSIWWFGPPFLKLKRDEWPKNQHSTNQEAVEESFSNEKTTVLLQPDIKNDSPLGLQIDEISTLHELLTQTAYRLRGGNLISNSENVTTEEMRTASIFWIKITQQTYFPEIVSSESFRTFQSKKLKHQFGLWKDLDGIWRCKGRIIFAELSEDEKFPVLLPSKGKFVTLLILHYHEKLHHAGVSQTLCEIRKSYWILRGRATVFRTLKKACINCRYFQCYPYCGEYF